MITSSQFNCSDVMITSSQFNCSYVMIKNCVCIIQVDISAPLENMPCCMTSNLWEIEPFPDNRTRRPTREVEEFPPREVYNPYTTYK